MPDSKLSALTQLAGTDVAAGDWFEAVDVSDTTMDAGGTNKKLSSSGLTLAASRYLYPHSTAGTYWTHGVSGSALAYGASQNQLHYIPVLLREGTLDRIGVRCTSTAASATCRVGLYANSETTRRPTGAALVDQSLSLSAATGLVEATISYDVPSTGLYWFGYVKQGVAAFSSGQILTTILPTSGGLSYGVRMEWSAGSADSQHALYYETGVSGTLPSVGSLTVGISSYGWPIYNVFVRYA